MATSPLFMVNDFILKVTVPFAKLLHVVQFIIFPYFGGYITFCKCREFFKQLSEIEE